MHSSLAGKSLSRIRILLLILVTALALLPSSGDAQKTAKKLSKQDVIDLLTGDVPSDQVAQEAQKAGISFQVTPAAVQEIKGAGGTDDLIRVLRGLAPRAPSTPAPPPHTNTPTASTSVLMIESTPGQSQVYIDDEPVGTTSRDGHLKLSRLSPGSHSVRVSLSGYQDYEQSVTLTGGQMVTVAATLQQVPPPPPVNPPHTEETPHVIPGQPGYLGVLPMEEQPAGARGVVISGAQPGGPADQAGLKTYDTILAVNGRPVTTPQELRATLASHHAGEVVEITWYNGSTAVSRRIRLATPPTPGGTTEQTGYPPTLSNMPHSGFATFLAAHDHGPNGQGGNDYCSGVMSIGNGMIYYKGTKGTDTTHNFEIPLNQIKESRRNAVYLVGIGAFHIKLKKGTNYNFVVLNQQNQYQPPDAILTAIDNAMGK